MTAGLNRRLKDWSRLPQPVPAASGILVQPFERRPHVSWTRFDPSSRVTQRAQAWILNATQIADAPNNKP